MAFFFLGVVERVLERGKGEGVPYTVHLIGKVGNQLINVHPPPSCIVHSDCVVLCSGAQDRTGHGQGSTSYSTVAWTGGRSLPGTALSQTVEQSKLVHFQHYLCPLLPQRSLPPTSVPPRAAQRSAAQRRTRPLSFKTPDCDTSLLLHSSTSVFFFFPPTYCRFRHFLPPATLAIPPSSASSQTLTYWPYRLGRKLPGRPTLFGAPSRAATSELLRQYVPVPVDRRVHVPRRLFFYSLPERTHVERPSAGSFFEISFLFLHRYSHCISLA